MPPAPSQIGPYRIVRPLGQGGMGAVYEAIQEPIGRRVALKVLLPQHAENHDTLTRFFNEARAVNLIEHPSIVQVSDYGKAPDGTAYLVMEYLRGEPLSDRLDRLNTTAQRLPWVEAAQLGAQIADAMGAAHDKSIVHRDLKPGNVMLVRDPAVAWGERAKILDFGIAKLTQGQAHGTATNALIGTPQYMSPEQCRGAGGVDSKTDVYALGIILYEMLAGRPPFLADSTVEYMGQHVFKEAPSLYDFAPKAHPPLVTLIHRLLVKDKAVRPTMREVGSELARLVASASGDRVAMTSAPVVDSEITRVAISARVLSPLSTLSGSLGQTINPGSRRLQVVGAAVAMATAGALSVLLFWHPTAKPAAPAPTAGHSVPIAAPESLPAVVARPDREVAPLAAGSAAAAAAAPPGQTAGSASTSPADSAYVAKPAAASPLNAKLDSSAAKPSASLRVPQSQEPASDSSKVVKRVAKVRQVPEAPLPVKTLMLPSSTPSQSPRMTKPTPKHPIGYED